VIGAATRGRGHAGVALAVRLAAAALAAVLGACGPTPIADARQDLLEGWGAWLLDRYATSARAADDLAAAVTSLCAAPDAAGLQAARDAWVAARRPWKEAEVFAFGPYSEEPIRLGPKADFWPARPDAVRAVLADDTPIVAAGLGAQQKGFAAIELLLWDPEAQDVVAALAAEPRRCAYLAVIVPDLAARVRELAGVWDHGGGDFLGELTEAGERDTMYETLHMAFGEVVNRIGYLLENIRSDKLGKPAGLVSGGGAQPDKLESPFSGRALEDVRDNLEGARRLLLGDGDDLGLDGYLRGRGRFLRPLVTARLEAAHEALDALEDAGPIADTLARDPALVEALVDRLGELQRAIQVDVLSALSLTVGFNDNDGD